MIESILLKTRTSDNVNVYTRYSVAYVEKATFKFVSEIPEGASSADYATVLAGRVKQDDTGLIYECAHDVEDSAHTYTEVFPDPADASEWDANFIPQFTVHKAYKSTETYAEGDICISGNKTYQSDFDDNVGNSPNIYGWTEILPYVERVEPVYKTLEELYPDEEEAAE